MSSHSTVSVLNFWSKVVTRGLHETSCELSPRQTAIMLSVYLAETPLTSKALAEELGISKAAISRALDHLSQAGLIKRRRDKNDGRVMLIHRTVKGSVFLADMADIIKKETQQFKTPEPTG
jgi:DNA-binding MarR family transcriptional regulator